MSIIFVTFKIQLLKLIFSKFFQVKTGINILLSSMPTATCELISTGIQEIIPNFLLLKQVSVIFAIIQRQLLLILYL